MENYIRSVIISGSSRYSRKEREIVFAMPSNGINAVNIICGKNRTGKSYILNCLHDGILHFNKQLVAQEATQYEVSIKDLNIIPSSFEDRFGNVAFIDDVAMLKKLVNAISINKVSKFQTRGHPHARSDKDTLIGFKKNLTDFAKDLLAFIASKEGHLFNSVSWEEDNDNSYRPKFIRQLDDKALYSINGCNELTEIFSSAINGSLYVAIRTTSDANSIIPYIVYDDEIQLPFQNWSDGQKVFFVCLIFIMYGNPSILIFDEMENHLHPEYISALLGFIKNRVSQSIISTHHPHIIFSKHIDSVWYLEIQHDRFTSPGKLTRRQAKGNKPPFRTVKELSSNFLKVVNTYRLFDVYDNQLLRLSSTVVSDLTDYCISIFTNLFNYEVVDNKQKSRPDLQTDGLAKYLLSRIQSRNIFRVLDIGAGKGKLLIDISRLGNIRLNKHVEWNLFEPCDKVRSQLSDNMVSLNQFNINILDAFPEKPIDLIVIANVIHELTPLAISGILSNAARSIAEDGEIVIVELYPLLNPEGLSVPYKFEDMKRLFRNYLNWVTAGDKIFFGHNAIEAYWLSAKIGSNSIVNHDAIFEQLCKFWRTELIEDRCADYVDRNNIRDASDTLKVMCELTSIASISSFFSGRWGRLI